MSLSKLFQILVPLYAVAVPDNGIYVINHTYSSYRCDSFETFVS